MPVKTVETPNIRLNIKRDQALTCNTFGKEDNTLSCKFMTSPPIGRPAAEADAYDVPERAKEKICKTVVIERCFRADMQSLVHNSNLQTPVCTLHVTDTIRGKSTLWER